MGLYLAYIRGYDWFPNFEKPKIDLWHVPRYEKFSYQGYHLFILKKSYKRNVGIKLFSPLLAKSNWQNILLIKFSPQVEKQKQPKGSLSLLAVINDYLRPIFNIYRKNNKKGIYLYTPERTCNIIALN